VDTGLEKKRVTGGFESGGHEWSRKGPNRLDREVVQLTTERTPASGSEGQVQQLRLHLRGAGNGARGGRIEKG